MDTDPTKFEGASRPTKGSEDPQGEFPEHRRREELLELLFAHVADAIFVAKPDGRIIDVNPAALRNDRLTFLSNPRGKRKCEVFTLLFTPGSQRPKTREPICARLRVPRREVTLSDTAGTNDPAVCKYHRAAYRVTRSSAES